ncbi:MAG: tetratricopeptide repeat protein [Acidimicrobiia bacterium]|nr:tetratricopeptide repeat protein [Acidimicrobiia bacterium]
MSDVTDATFTTDVVERSNQVPVVVDLWAPWCGPCKQLGPLIEKIVGETDGAVELAKVNVDENPQVAQLFKVQGIPAVFAIADGQVVDNFVGAQGEDFLRDFVGRLAPSAEASEVEQLVAIGDEDSLRRALEIDSDNPDAVVALAELLVDAGNTDEALGLLARIPESAETRRVQALARTGDVASDDIEPKLIELLERVKDDDDARQEFIDLLEVLGPDDPRSIEYRRQLTSRLY